MLNLYKATQTPSIIKVPPVTYCILSGEGDPNNSHLFQDSVEALFSVSYTLKFMIKKGETTIPAQEYKVSYLEGQWYAVDMTKFSMEDKSNWKWHIMISQPDFVTVEVLEAAKKKALSKKSNARIPHIRLEILTDGLSAHVLHLGPYSAERPTIQKLHAFITDSGYSLTGYHREIYLSDMRKTASEKLKTIIRQPIAKV